MSVQWMRNHWWWRPGWRLGRHAYTFHITFQDDAVVGGPDLRRLVEDHQAKLVRMDSLDLVPLEWLHLTMQNVGFTDEVSDEEIEAVAMTAVGRCADVEPFELTFGPAEIRAEAVALHPSPAEPVSRLRDVLRDAIASVRGASGVPEAPEHAQGFRPHVSVAYSNTNMPAQSVAEVLKEKDPKSVAVVVRAASLIIINRDERMYRWRTYGTVPLNEG
jgi:2'-5' RNA ligase